jgi:hypothetical protein
VQGMYIQSLKKIKDMKHFFLTSGNKYLSQIEPNTPRTPSEEISEPLYPFEHDINTMDGGEFLDDFARMKEQPAQTEKTQNKDI